MPCPFEFTESIITKNPNFIKFVAPEITDSESYDFQNFLLVNRIVFPQIFVQFNFYKKSYSYLNKRFLKIANIHQQITLPDRTQIWFLMAVF